jgi:hypothetical protein
MGDEVKAGSMDELLAHIPVTEEGKARWRARLAELDATWTPERWEELRKRFGLS